MEAVLDKIQEICAVFGSNWILVAGCVAVFFISCACVCRSIRVQVRGTEPPCWVKLLFWIFPSCTPKLCCCCVSLEKYFFKCPGAQQGGAHWALKEDQVQCEGSACQQCLLNIGYINGNDQSDMEDGENKAFMRRS